MIQNNIHSTPFRVLLFGNSGSGKSTYARTLTASHPCLHLDLDPFAWEPTDPPTRTPIEDATRAIQAHLHNAPSWVVEGCYADLLQPLTPQATHMIFLDLPVQICQKHARQRPWEPHKYPSKEAQDANLPMLLDWIASYPNRSGPLGRPQHLALFESFDGNKQHIQTI